jgi:PIN domain nuclease of toxin-antitoxin system
VILIDTHALIWAVNNERRLGRGARARIDAATADGVLFVSAITPWEIAMLAHRGRLTLGRETAAWIDAVLAAPGVVVAPIEPMIAVDSVSLPDYIRADPADRIIIATARHHGWPILTADQAILDYGAAGYVGVIDATR